MGSINYLHAIKPDTAYLKKIIESSLLSDWAIHIEHHNGMSDTTDWQLWDKVFFAIRSAETVMTALMDCYKRHPKSLIRIRAEKFRPQTRILYTVYDPQLLPADTSLATQPAAGQSHRDRDPVSVLTGLRSYT